MPENILDEGLKLELANTSAARDRMRAFVDHMRTAAEQIAICEAYGEASMTSRFRAQEEANFATSSLVQGMKIDPPRVVFSWTCEGRLVVFWGAETIDLLPSLIFEIAELVITKKGVVKGRHGR